MNLLKNKRFMTVMIILASFGILFFRFGRGLFTGLFAIGIIALALFLFCTDKGKDIVYTLLGLGVTTLILYFLFGWFIIPVGIIVIALYVGPRLQRRVQIEKTKIEDKLNNEGKNEALKKLVESGYFHKILDKRLKALNVYPAAIQSLEVNWGTWTPKELWLTLDQQYEFFMSNADRMSNLELSYDLYDMLNTLNKSFENLKYNQGCEFYYIQSLKHILKDYGFDLYKAEEAISMNLNKYIRLYDNEREAFFSNLSRAKSGVDGENRVNDELALFKDLFVNIKNIRLELEGTSVESDNILLTENGIFSVEVKNFGESGKYSITIAKDGQWLKEYDNGTIEPMKNVSAQLNRHIGIKQRFLNEELRKKLNNPDLPYIHLHPLIVIANDKVIIKNESDLSVIRPSSIYHYVTNFQGTHLDREYWPMIKEIFESHSLAPKAYPISTNFDSLELVYPQIWEQLKAYYVFCSMLRTYKEDLIHAGIHPNENEKFSKETFDSNILPMELNEYKNLYYKSESEFSLRK